MSYDDYMVGVKLETLSTPKSGMFEVKVNEWWLVDQSGNLVFYRRSKQGAYRYPMCNPDKKIADLIVKKYPLHEVKQIPIVFIPHSCGDYT